MKQRRNKVLSSSEADSEPGGIAVDLLNAHYIEARLVQVQVHSGFASSFQNHLLRNWVMRTKTWSELGGNINRAHPGPPDKIGHGLALPIKMGLGSALPIKDGLSQIITLQSAWRIRNPGAGSFLVSCFNPSSGVLSQDPSFKLSREPNCFSSEVLFNENCCKSCFFVSLFCEGFDYKYQPPGTVILCPELSGPSFWGPS